MQLGIFSPHMKVGDVAAWDKCSFDSYDSKLEMSALAIHVSFVQC